MENPQYALFDQYLDGDMPPEARKAFEAQLTSDAHTAQEFRLHETARAAITLQGMFDYREQLYQRGKQMLFWKKWQWKTQDVFEQIFTQPRSNGSPQLRWGRIGGLALATALLLLFIVNPGLFFPDTPGVLTPGIVPKEQAAATFKTHFKRLDLSNTLGGSNADTLFQKAQENYSTGDCDAALQTLDLLLADPNLDRRPMALLLKGTCLLEQGNPESAIKVLKEVPPAAARLHEEAQWYIALAQLAQGQNEDASEILKQIAEAPKHRHYQEARKILNL